MIYNDKFIINENQQIYYDYINMVQTKEFFLLIPFKKKENYFLIGYIQYQILIFEFYKIQRESNLSLTMIKNYTTYIKIFSKSHISCNSLNNFNNIICSYFENDRISISLFDIDNYLNINSTKIYNYYTSLAIININLAVSKDNKKVLVSYYNQSLYFFVYDISQNISSPIIHTNECFFYNHYNFLKIFHFQNTKEYICGCFDSNGNYILVKFDENLNSKNIMYINSSNYLYSDIKYYSMIYMKNNNNYAFIINYWRKNATLNILPNQFSPNETMINFNTEYYINTDLAVTTLPNSYVTSNNSNNYISDNMIKDIVDKTFETFLDGQTNAKNLINDNNNNESFFGHENSTKEENINIFKNIIYNEKINLTSIINGDESDFIKKINNIIYQITTTENQKNNKFNNISKIDLGECENILKNIYNISENQSLIIFKSDYSIKNSLIPIIEYEIYDSIKQRKLDLSYCKNSTLNLSIPVSINEDNLYKYNPESDYYKDLCYSSTTEKGTDILLNDRYIEYNENNLAICENNCSLAEYISDTKQLYVNVK